MKITMYRPAESAHRNIFPKTVEKNGSFGSRLMFIWAVFFHLSFHSTKKMTEHQVDQTLSLSTEVSTKNSCVLLTFDFHFWEKLRKVRVIKSSSLISNSAAK